MIPHPISLRESPKSGHPETTRKIMICDCLPIVSVLLSEILKSPATIFKSIKTFLPTGRLIVGRDAAPAQANSQRNHYFSGGQSGRPDLGLCLTA
jgi:hypothetical protein